MPYAIMEPVGMKYWGVKMVKGVITKPTLRNSIHFVVSRLLTNENNNLNIHSEPSIKSDRGQHSQFLRCF